MYVGNHLYCDRFTLPSLIRSFLKKFLTINDDQTSVANNNTAYGDGKTVESIKNRRVSSLFKKNYHC